MKGNRNLTKSELTRLVIFIILSFPMISGCNW